MILGLMIIAFIAIIAAIILLVLHFIIGINLSWGILLCVIGSTLNLIAALLRLKEIKAKKNQNDKDKK